MMGIEEHVERLFRDIPDSERKEQMKREIVQNLQEKVSDLMAQGKAQEDAVNKAIVEFGDIEDIRAELATVAQPKRKSSAGLGLGFSVCGSLLIIGLTAFINLYYTPGTIWFVFPTFAILWWPLAMLYSWLKERQK